MVVYQWRPNCQQGSKTGRSRASGGARFWIEQTYTGTRCERNREPPSEAAP